MNTDLLGFDARPEAAKIVAAAGLSAADEAVENQLEAAKDLGYAKLAKLDFSPEEILALFGLESPETRAARRAKNKEGQVTIDTPLPVGKVPVLPAKK